MNTLERNRTNGLLRLRDPSNSYKCYESIPTPSPITVDSSNAKNVSNGTDTLKNGTTQQNTANDTSSLHRPASLDSLQNSSEQESSEDDMDQLSDSDSLTELKNITGTNTKQSESPRKSDIEGFKNVEPPKEPVIKAYLEKSHKKCDYKNCGFKKPDPTQLDQIEAYGEYMTSSVATIEMTTESPTSTSSSSSDSSPSQQSTQECSMANGNNCKPGQIPLVNSAIKTRRTSTGSVGRMETIIEEPIEPKVSVKEILARFETLREAAEVMVITLSINNF